MMKVEVLGIKIDQVTYQEALEKVKRILETKGKHYIVTPNPEIIVAAQKDAEFKNILNKADLSLADGAGLIKLARLTGKHLPERIAGVDFASGLAGLAQEFNYNIFLLGGKENVAKIAAENLKNRFPKLKIAGTFAGKSAEASDKETLDVLSKEEIDILIVAYGHGKQEKWIKRNLKKLDVKVAIGVGGALDYISGRKRRAPKFVQKANLEWLFRLLIEPWRVRRQLTLPYFVYLILKERIFKR